MIQRFITDNVHKAGLASNWATVIVYIILAMPTGKANWNRNESSNDTIDSKLT